MPNGSRWVQGFAIAAVALLTVGFSVTAWCQERPISLLLVRAQAKASQSAEYEEAQKELHARMGDHGVPFMSVVFHNRDEYLYCVPFGFAGELDISPLDKAFGEFAQSLGGEENRALIAQIRRSMVSKSTSIGALQLRFSYRPENPFYAFDPKEPCLLVLCEWKIQADKVLQAITFFKEYAALARKKESRIPFYLIQIIVGVDCPRYYIATFWKDVQQLEAHGADHKIELGEEGEKLFEKIRGVSRGSTVERMQYSPELSYYPEK